MEIGGQVMVQPEPGSYSWVRGSQAAADRQGSRGVAWSSALSGLGSVGHLALNPARCPASFVLPAKYSIALPRRLSSRFRHVLHSLIIVRKRASD